MIIIYIPPLPKTLDTFLYFLVSAVKKNVHVSKKKKRIRDARRVFRAAVARTRNNGIPTSRLISKTNFRDVNETKSGARRGGNLPTFF